jgi:hypothetical protein
MSTGSDNPCFGCRAGFHNECESVWLEVSEQECCCGGDVKFDMAGNVLTQEDTADVITGIDNGYIDDGYQGTKSLSEYSDPVSTGRKRAKEMYPIHAGMVCEWAGLKFAGGGVIPIVGCVGRPASDRHHGPDKNTMNNAPGNLHRICDHCHNTWHALNDPHYGERPEHTKPFLPLSGECAKHDAVSRATTAEIIEAETKRLTA